MKRPPGNADSMEGGGGGASWERSYVRIEKSAILKETVI